jgi:hypothetical protein
MKHLTVESFVNSMNEEDLWKIIDEYERYGARGYEAHFLMDKALEYCDTFCYREAYAEYMPEIVLYAYRHFALKYKQVKND